MNVPAITNLTKLTSFIAILLLLVSSQSFAQIEEITVTAQKREQSIQDVPVAVTAFSSQELREYQFNDLRDVAQQTPNLRLAGYYDSKPEIIIRGYAMSDLFTALDSNPVGVYNDEVYTGSRAGLLSQMFDLERVEVLRGPQGTLWGRNTTGGAVHFVSRKPDTGGELNGYGSFTAGRFEQLDFEGAVGLPLIKDVLAMRVSAIKRDSDGYTNNLFDGSDLDGVDFWAGRAQFTWTPTSDMEWKLAFDVSESENNGPGWHVFGQGNNEPSLATGYVEDPDFHTLSNNFSPLTETRKAGITLHGDIGLDLFGGTTLTTITNYQVNNTDFRNDWDGQPFDLGRDTNIHDLTKQFSQEVRLASDNAERLNWTAGFYYYTDEVDGGQLQTVFGFFDYFNEFVQDNDAWAVFANLEYELTDQINLRGGVRYTDEEKDIVVNASDIFFTPAIVGFTDSESWDALTGMVGLDWTPTDDVLLYASYNRGFKSGGYNGGAFNSPTEVGPFDPEFIDAYEIGAKTSWFDDKLRLNAALFYNEIKDLQALVPSGAFFFIIDNASSAEIMGAEIELFAQPTERLSMSLSAGFLDTEYGDFIHPSLTVAFPGVSVVTDLTGNELPHNPSETFGGMLQYDIPFLADSRLTPRFEFSHVGDHLKSGVGRPIDAEDGYTVLNAKLSWTSADERYQAMLWMNNLADEEYRTSTTGTLAFVGFTGSAGAQHAPPRSYGITLRYTFE